MSSEDQLNESNHRRIAEFVERTAGIQLPPSKRYLVAGRLSRRKVALGFETLKEYLSFVMDTPEGHQERVSMIESLTTHKTQFFRENEHFEFLKSDILPQLIGSRQTGFHRPFRIWSAGCSSGEEAYSLSMLLSDFQQSHRNFRFEIYASDLSNRILKKAINATYDHAVIEPVPMPMRRRYLLKGKADHNLIRVDKPVRDHVRFFQLNLLRDDFTFAKEVDVILCRNVMIYFNQQDKDRLVRKFIRLLPDPGYLFIGHSERLGDDVAGVALVVPTVYSTRKTKSYAKR